MPTQTRPEAPTAMHALPQTKGHHPPQHPPHRRMRATVGGLVCSLALGGCASVMRVDSDVSHHANWPSGAMNTGTVSYTFERLPSQSEGASALRQSELEELARQVLATKGWQWAGVPPAASASAPASSLAPAPTSSVGPGPAPAHAPAPTAAPTAATAPVTATPATPAPAWRVQVSASQTTLPRAPWDDPPMGAWPRVSLNAGNAGLGLGLSWGLLRGDMPYHQRSVSVVVRDGRQGQVAYEAQAAHDGRWNSTPAIWQAMLEAALTGFPQPNGTRQQINIDVPR